jgi:hypothetical protein
MSLRAAADAADQGVASTARLTSICPAVIYHRRRMTHPCSGEQGCNEEICMSSDRVEARRPGQPTRRKRSSRGEAYTAPRRPFVLAER